MTDEIVLAALRTQEEERADGYFSGNPSLQEIQRQLAPAELLSLVRELRRSRDAPVRELAARLLKEGPVPATSVTDEVRRALGDEEDPSVIRWLVSALQYARDPRALPDLKRLAGHPESEVRFGVPDALSFCAPQWRDVEDDLLQLSKDPEPDVRWSATFELAAWLEGPPDGTSEADLARIRARLEELAQSEPDPDTRATAAEALKQAHRERP
jgi:HEAT repeat protein